jgi:hypothetical protein
LSPTGFSPTVGKELNIPDNGTGLYLVRFDIQKADLSNGKPKRQMELSGPDGGPLDIHMTDEELDERIAELTEQLNQAKWPIL